MVKEHICKTGINENNNVILAGSNRDIFNSNNFIPWTSDKIENSNSSLKIE